MERIEPSDPGEGSLDGLHWRQRPLPNRFGENGRRLRGDVLLLAHARSSRFADFPTGAHYNASRVKGLDP